MDLEQWGLERIRDQEKIIVRLSEENSAFRARLADCLGVTR